jgi:acetyl esterase
LVYLHGGGWVRGDLDTHDNVCRALCARAGCAVLSVDYRRAPEHPFPAALEDCYAALEWTAEHAGRLTLDPDRIAVGGDSAGGNLSAGLALMTRDRDGPALARQLLIYPAVASPELQSFDSYEENAFGYLLERPGIEWYYERYAPSPAQARNEYLAPLLAGDLSGLAPATVVTAGFDPLRDEGIEYADRLAADGVDVEHRHYEGMIHAFVSLPEVMSTGDEALSAMAGDLRAAFE